MTAGQPHVADSHSTTNAAANAAQAASIRQMLATGAPPTEVAARHHCAVARVHDLARHPAPATTPAVARIPAPRVSRRRPARELPVQPAEQPQATRDRLVRHIAADPVLLGWLHEHNAKILEAAADALAAEHHPAAEATIRRLAAIQRAGHGKVWGGR